MNTDILGTFRVKRPSTTEGDNWEYPKCDSCAKNVPTAVTYQKLEFAEKYADIKPESTLLNKGMTFGIECGCYAKLHRQISHIHDHMLERTNG